MTVPTFLLYLVTWLVVALSPGPAVMLSVAQATKHGFRASLSGIAWIQCGNLIFFVGAALGLGALLSSAAGAFTALRVVGAVYLFYLGARAVVLSFRRPETVVATAVVPATNRSLFLQGALVQLTNPKALLFVSALLPQFFDPAFSSSQQLTLLAVGTIVVDLAVLSSYAYVAQRGLRRFQSSTIGIYLERGFGAALMFFGVRLLLVRK